jgi:8-oxo-dGTP pyrophosphatase MutT (NUDIX family)
MTSEMWKPHVVAATIVERDGRFLCVEERVDGRTVFNQPAGHLDPGETLVAAAVRETLEETAWTVAVTSLLGIYLMDTEIADKTFLRFCFVATAERFDPERRLDVEIVRAHWFTRDELHARSAQHRSPLVMRTVDDYLGGQRYPLSLLHAYLRN